MKAKIAKIIVRVIGTLSAMVGLAMLCGLLVMVKNGPSGFTWIVIPILGQLPFVVWFLYVGYLVWASFSPFAVRLVCGTFCFITFFFLFNFMGFIYRHDEDNPWVTFAFVGSIPVTWVVYRAISKRLNRWLFPEFG